MAKPKPTGFQWKRMPTPFHGKEYRVWGDVDGKRKQFWFATEKEAKAVCADRNQKREAYGSKENLDSEARLEAFRAAQLLEGSGKSILDAVRFYLDHQKRTSASGPFSELAGKVRAEFKRRLERLFRAADPAVIPFLTLSFFCGVRVATLERLSWADVKFEERRVIVPRYKGKNQKRYPVTISENALEWLKPYVRKSGSLLVAATSINRPGAAFGSPSRSRTATRNLIKAAAHRAGVALPDNAGRHTFISMHVAAYESLDKTATESDNSPALIKSNYLGIVSREDAAKYWALRPI
jgi:integrase